jgi:4-hydroxythreonine-4-phosphate dehydrogenase
MGDPGGIGPEICLRLLNDPGIARACRLSVFGSVPILAKVSQSTGIRFETPSVPAGESTERIAVRGHTIVDCGSGLSGIRPGRPSPAGGRMAAKAVRAAVRAVLAGGAAALVTAPVSKESLAMAGLPFLGHTEMLAELTGSGRICMTLASGRIVVSLVTTHVPLCKVPSLLSIRRVADVIALTDEMMFRILNRRPRIGVCGLNPHCGENGLLGDEEERVVMPAVEKARSRGISVFGPWPPDTAFVPSRRAQTDAYVAMYHDQGLIPFKMMSFATGVNITLGLPIVRTSPDHGTAFDIAWQGRASVSSMISAVRWALRLTRSAPAAVRNACPGARKVGRHGLT